MEEKIKTLATLVANRIVSDGSADGSPIIGVDIEVVRDLVMSYYYFGEITRDELLSAAFAPYFKKVK